MKDVKNVLLTGGSGFLGQFIYSELSNRCIVDTLGRSESNIKIDLSDQYPILKNQYDLVIHAAGKAHVVPKTEDEASEFYSVNVKGTENLLKGLMAAPALPTYFLFISTVAVYGALSGNDIKEDYPLSAIDPYGKSKVAAEKLVWSWCLTHNVRCTIFRLPLIAGRNPPGNLKAMISGIRHGYYFNIGEGKARKSIVLAEDVAKQVLKAVQVGGVYNLTDGYHPSIGELSEMIARQLRKSRPLSIPFILANTLAKFGDMIGNSSPINTSKVKKITTSLTFDDSKARASIQWKPNAVLKRFKIS